MFFYASDRWFVKLALPSTDFAYYSFAISMMGLISILINSVTMTFYPYLSSLQGKDKIISIKKYLLIIGTLSSGGYFVFAIIVNIFLRKYIPSLMVISILFAGYPAIIIINALYINLYKIQKQGKKYLYTVIKMLLISIILNFIAILVHRSIFAIALATTISFYVWYVYSSKDFSILKLEKKEIIYLGLFLIIFYTSSICLNWWYGLSAYSFGIATLIYSFYKKEVVMLLKEFF